MTIEKELEEMKEMMESDVWIEGDMSPHPTRLDLEWFVKEEPVDTIDQVS